MRILATPQGFGGWGGGRRAAARRGRAASERGHDHAKGIASHHQHQHHMAAYCLWPGACCHMQHGWQWDGRARCAAATRRCSAQHGAAELPGSLGQSGGRGAAAGGRAPSPSTSYTWNMKAILSLRGALGLKADSTLTNSLKLTDSNILTCRGEGGGGRGAGGALRRRGAEARALLPSTAADAALLAVQQPARRPAGCGSARSPPPGGPPGRRRQGRRRAHARRPRQRWGAGGRARH
jgi:hypothetical protein